jgi:hypothetical protein
MKNIKIYLIGLITLFACSSKVDKQTTNNSTNYADTTKTKIDTISDFKQIGVDILNGKQISEIDEKVLNQFIDSIMVDDSSDRKFYFKVFEKIREGGKGEIQEFISWKVISFSEKYPDDFFVLPENDLNQYAKVIGELFATEEENPLKKAQEYFENIKSKSKSNISDKFVMFEVEINKTIIGRK